MGVKTTKKTVTETSITDDFDGKDLPNDTKPVKVKLDGKTYSLYLSPENEAVVNDKIGEYAEFVKTLTKGATTSGSGTGSGAGRTPVDYKGYEFDLIREWAVTNGKSGKSGAPITPSTRVLNQDLIDEFVAAQK